MEQIIYPTELNGLWIGDVYVHEPGGLITNAIMALLCVLFYWKTTGCACPFARNWRSFLLLLGLGTLGGCFTHGFPTMLGETGFYILWFVKNALVPAANAFALLGVAAAYGKSDEKWVCGALFLKAVLVIVALGMTVSFTPVAIDLGLSYLILVIASALAMKVSKAMRYIFYAFVCALLSGLFYIFKYDVDRLWLTHKDMVHVFAFLSIWLVYKAVQSASSSHHGAKVEAV